MAEIDVRSRPGWRGVRMNNRLVSPVLFPIFLILLIVGDAFLRLPS